MAARKPRPYNGGTWTQGAFNSFIKGLLRRGSMRWKPINEVKRKARVERGKYLCAMCGAIVPPTIPDPTGKKKRITNIVVDHIHPIVPVTGFTSWDDVIKGMFVEEDGLQLLCSECHSIKTQRENQQRRANNKAEEDV